MNIRFQFLEIKYRMQYLCGKTVWRYLHISEEKSLVWDTSYDGYLRWGSIWEPLVNR